jgi:host factor-I protein
MSVFDSGLPSVRQIQSFIKNKLTVEISLITKTTLRGKILWQDANCLCLINEEENDKTLIWFQAIVYLKPELSSTIKDKRLVPSQS